MNSISKKYEKYENNKFLGKVIYINIYQFYTSSDS